MLDITNTRDEALDLPQGFSIDMEETSPVFNDRGSMTLPATVPATPRNCRILGNPQRLDNTEDVRKGRCMRVADGVKEFWGSLVMDSASASDGLSFSIGVDNSVAYGKWSNRKLPDLSGLPKLEAVTDSDGNRSIIESINRRRNANSREEPLAFFPFLLEDDQMINAWYRSYGEPATIEPPTKRYIDLDGTNTEVTVPAAYGVSPLLRVWAVLDYIFADMGLTIGENIFRTDPELSRLVVMNNTADACVRGYVEFADLMPDVTVETFLHSLWVRFGLVYQIDSTRSTVRLRFVRDIIKAPNSGEDIATMLSGRPLVTFTAPQYVKLSASSSIEGAAPPTERWEDFVRANSDSDFLYGQDVWNWSKLPDPKVDFEADPPDYDDDPSFSDPDFWPDPDEGRDPDYDDYFDQEPDDDRDDGRDDGDRDVEDDREVAPASVEPAPRSAMSADPYEAAVYSSKRAIASYSCFTGLWYKLDRYNGKTELQGTSYFNYDPQPEGLEAFDLTSEDEWLPVGAIRDTHVLPDTSAIGPRFLVAPRHLHTFIAGHAEAEGECPLAFAFAINGTGCVIPEEPSTGKPIMVDGVPHTLSLLFQFRGGLFERFWSGFDEFLRHANRTVEVAATLPKSRVMGLDMLAPLNMAGQPYLIDMAAYPMPMGPQVPVNLTLRSRMPVGSYDLEKEQHVVMFGPFARELEWYCYRMDLEDVVYGKVNKEKAVSAWVEANGPAPEIESLSLSYRATPLRWTTERQVTWQTDSKLPAPVSVSQRRMRNYYARVTYALEAIYLEQQDPWIDDPQPVEMESLGTIEVSAVYSVELRVRVKRLSL